ncbi:MAG: hypothetical protein QGH94_15660, partial [Phycisphaerae bacterium]|nr:hypothetical protein [Phycisphaerae bacterium]
MTVILADLPPLGGYVSVVKVVFMLLLITPWLMVLPWIHRDVARVRGSQTQWMLIVGLAGVFGLLIWLIWPMYVVGMVIYIVLVSAVIAGYVVWRDGRVGPGQK